MVSENIFPACENAYAIVSTVQAAPSKYWLIKKTWYAQPSVWNNTHINSKNTTYVSTKFNVGGPCENSDSIVGRVLRVCWPLKNR